MPGGSPTGHYRKQVAVDTGPKARRIRRRPAAPVLLRLHSGNFNFEGVSDNGADLRFVAGDDKTVLNHQIESSTR